MVSVRKNDLENLLFYAFRYTLGRMSYCVDDVGDMLRKYKDSLHRNTIKTIIEETEEAISQGKAGMRMDIEKWQQLVKEFKDE